MTAGRYSIRRRLVLRTMACVLCIFGAISVAAHLFARHETEEFFNARLASSARILQGLLAHQLETATIANPIVIDIPREIPARGPSTRYGHPYEHKIAFQIWQADGKLLARSASAPAAALAALAKGYGERQLDGALWQTFALRSGGVWIVAAEKDEVREEMVEELGTSVLLPVIAGGLVLLLSVNLVLTSTLAPIRDLASGIAGREAESLSPVILREVPDELQPVVDELNNLLQRMRDAFRREKRFIDAAAHELRTPLTAVQLHVQNAMQAVNNGEREQSLQDAQAALRRTIRLAEQLLTFSRLASGTDLVRREPVALAQVCAEMLALLQPLMERSGQIIRIAAPDAGLLQGDRYRLQQLVRNLLDNAAQHGAKPGVIDVTVMDDGYRVTLTVANDGEPVPESEVADVFAPYYRRHPESGQGAGLGLSIVQEIAQQHGATLNLGRKADGQGCVVTVTFPAGSRRLPPCELEE